MSDNLIKPRHHLDGPTHFRSGVKWSNDAFLSAVTNGNNVCNRLH